MSASSTEHSYTFEAIDRETGETVRVPMSARKAENFLRDTHAVRGEVLPDFEEEL